MLLVYPAIALPISIAYLARYAFQTDLAFYLVLATGFLVGGITYSVSLESAVEAADQRREALLAALSRGEGPIG
jgi:ABC-2 type transport system permease protein